jgi:hypothetical protein
LKVNILAFDYTGYGIHEGKPSERACYDDIISAFRYLVDVKNIIPGSKYEALFTIRSHYRVWALIGYWSCCSFGRQLDGSQIQKDTQKVLDIRSIFLHKVPFMMKNYFFVPPADGWLH